MSLVGEQKGFVVEAIASRWFEKSMENKGLFVALKKKLKNRNNDVGGGRLVLSC